MKLWMEVSQDKYSLPVAVADTPQALAKMTGKAVSTIISLASMARHKKMRERYISVDLEWRDDE